MTAIRRITERRELAGLAAQLRVRPDWHEPSEQDVTAQVFGDLFDNAGAWGEGAVPASGFEIWIRLYQEDQPVADVNMATLLAWAAGQPAAGAPQQDSAAGILLTAGQLHAWAGLGRDLTGDELEAIDECIPDSSIPDAIGTIATEALRLRSADDEEEAGRG